MSYNKAMKKILLILFICTLSTLHAKPSARHSYNNLIKLYKGMRNHPLENKYRHNYIRYVRYFKTFNKSYTGYNPRREHAKFQVIAIHNDLAFVSGIKSDFIIAYNLIDSFIRRTSNPSLKTQAEYMRKGIRRIAKEKKITQITKNVQRKREFGKALTSSFSNVTKIVKHKNSLTIHSDKKIRYFMSTKENIKYKHIIIDIQNARLGPNPLRIARRVSNVKNLKFSQHTSKLIRVEYEFDKRLDPVVTLTRAGRKSNFAVRPPSIAKRVKLAINRKFKILIDPGHGGDDPGTTKNSTEEKDLTLKISKKLGAMLKKQRFQVFYTRKNDRTLSLNERADIAHKINPDLFISIHANSSKNRRVFGIETYYFDVKGDETTMKIAARENSNSGKISDIDFILQDLTVSKNFLDAGVLASTVQNSIIAGVSKKYKSTMKNRGTRGGPFYVLYRTGIPSILVEVGFLSNRREARRLKSRKYQHLLSKQIAAGISKFAKSSLKNK
jgi:N-acetylmuramoyl-L-alanine amidase